MPTNSRATRAVERILNQLPADRREKLIQIRRHLHEGKDGPGPMATESKTPNIMAPGYRDKQTPVWYSPKLHPKGKMIVSTAPTGRSAYPADAVLHSEYRCTRCPERFTAERAITTHAAIAHAEATGRRWTFGWYDGNGKRRPTPPNRLAQDLGQFHPSPRRTSKHGFHKPIVSTNLDPHGRPMYFPGGEPQLRAEAERHNREVQE